jgi:hypothetical protein
VRPEDLLAQQCQYLEENQCIFLLYYLMTKSVTEQNMKVHVKFEVFMVVTMKNAVFWDVMPCGSCKNQRFGGT